MCRAQTCAACKRQRHTFRKTTPLTSTRPRSKPPSGGSAAWSVMRAGTFQLACETYVAVPSHWSWPGRTGQTRHARHRVGAAYHRRQGLRHSRLYGPDPVRILSSKDWIVHGHALTHTTLYHYVCDHAQHAGYAPATARRPRRRRRSQGTIALTACIGHSTSSRLLLLVFAKVLCVPSLRSAQSTTASCGLRTFESHGQCR